MAAKYPETLGCQTMSKVLGPGDGDIMGAPDGVRDRFMIDGNETGGRFALVEHLMAPKPRALAAPPPAKKSATC